MIYAALLTDEQREKLANAADERSWTMQAETVSDEVLAHADQTFWTAVERVLLEQRALLQLELAELARQWAEQDSDLEPATEQQIQDGHLLRDFLGLPDDCRCRDCAWLRDQPTAPLDTDSDTDVEQERALWNELNMRGAEAIDRALAKVADEERPRRLNDPGGRDTSAARRWPQSIEVAGARIEGARVAVDVKSLPIYKRPLGGIAPITGHAAADWPYPRVLHLPEAMFAEVPLNFDRSRWGLTYHRARFSRNPLARWLEEYAEGRGSGFPLWPVVVFCTRSMCRAALGHTRYVTRRLTRTSTSKETP